METENVQAELESEDVTVEIAKIAERIVKEINLLDAAIVAMQDLANAGVNFPDVLPRLREAMREREARFE